MARKKRRYSTSKMFSMGTAKRVGAVGAGLVGAKLINAPLKKIPFLGKYLSGDSKVGSISLAGLKIILGLYGQKMKNQYIKDMGLGAAAVGLLEGVVAVYPKASAYVGGLSYQDDVDFLGSTVDINLDELNGSRFDNDLENYQEVAGHETDDFLESDQVIAGDMMVDEDYDMFMEYA